jgi:hypothetical protein
MRSVLLALVNVVLVATAGCSDDGEQPIKDLSVDIPSAVDLAPDLPGNLKQVYNAAHPDPGCADIDGALSQDVNEQPFWAVARLSPTSYPFTVVLVGYKLWSKNNNSSIKTCDAHIAHKLAVWVSDKTKPEDTPTMAFTKDVPEWTSSSTMTMRTVEISLDTPIQLQSGEHLYVAVQVRRDPDDNALTMCLQACVGEKLVERSFISSDAAAPYTWSDLYVDVQSDFTPTTWAMGYDG